MNSIRIQKGYLFVITAVAVGVLLLLPNIADTMFTSSYSFLLALGKITAVAGAILYAISFVLSTRIKYLEELFGGLNRVYIAHHTIAGIAFICLLLHPTFLALRYLPQDIDLAAQQLLPAFAPYDFALNAGIFGLWFLVLLMIVTFYIKLPYHIWHLTHKFLGLAFLIAVLHIFLIPSDISTNMPLRIYVLGWAFIGLAAFAYYTLFGKFIIKRTHAKVANISQHPGNITFVSLETENTKLLDFKPGQFIFVRFHADGVPSEPHPFSIASYIAPNTIQLGIKGLGDFTNKMPALKIGAEAEIEGAYGKFSYLHGTKKQQLWIAGGIGITPFLAMIQTLQNNPDYDIVMLYSVKEEQELIGQQITDYIQQHAQFKLYNYVSNTEGKLLDVSYIAATVPDFTAREVFICGPPQMMQSLRAQFKQSGIANSAIHTEEFSLQ